MTGTLPCNGLNGTCAGSQLSLAPPFHELCMPIQLWSGSLTHSPATSGPRVVSKRYGRVTPAGSTACVIGFQPDCANTTGGVVSSNPRVSERVPK
ncbi:Uncharacterised protein [Mycobacterium tuberculosis]|nr:Uncharacterised protein [Mycobacterium tuberculosis]CKQ94602.1 Uncharacterised protein [Mycobacterium tuberculosis]CKS07102.1 Uncharacterised protein [Mycobacterium tuberculosis]CKT47483.1 Uncharacterised protein [Mycobacterium tuberculosis]CND38417.1 Uncharacterised protein [Mycobacterium tuberculosis]